MPHHQAQVLIGNLNAIAMEPLGHIAGVGAPVAGLLSPLISIPLGIVIGQCCNETVFSLVGGFAILSAVSLLVTHWADSASQQK